MRIARTFLDEPVVLFRTQDGAMHALEDRCCHRLAPLSCGRIEGDDLRCMYHGWKFNGTGQCIERPAEGDAGPTACRIAGYPLHEYCGLIFAYMGEGAAPE